MLSSNTRLIIALACAALLAALATPELSARLPSYVGPALAAAVAAVLHKLNAEPPPPPEFPPSGQP